jgi:uncharacterized protein YccT (UPF0319 family)
MCVVILMEQKMKKPLTALAFASVFASSTLSAATLHVPMAFEYLAVDGQKIAQNLVIHKSELELKPGYHEIAIRYYDVVETDMMNYEEVVKSKPFIITLNVTDDVDFYLAPANGDRIRHPQQFAESPDVGITRKDGGAVDYKFTQTDISQKEFSSRLYDQNVAQETTVVAAPPVESSGLSPVEEDVPSAPGLVTTATAGSKAVEAGETTATPAQMLQIWWQRADEETRREFLSWAVKQL